MIHLYEISRIGKSIQVEITLVVAQGWGHWTVNEYGASLCDDENVIKHFVLLCNCEYTKNY